MIFRLRAILNANMCHTAITAAIQTDDNFFIYAMESFDLTNYPQMIR